MHVPRLAGSLTWAAILGLMAIVLVFAAIRVVGDVPRIVSGSLPSADTFEYRYVANAWLAYAHIAPGVVYLLLAPIQLWRGFRNRHMRWHRRIGRIALVSGLVSGLLAIVVGAVMPWGGLLEGSAAVLFGVWFVAALLLAYRAIRRRDIVTHRRFMIRAFAIGLGVGTIRIWIGLLEGFDLLEFREAFGVAFWLGLSMHAVAAELWLRWRPAPDDPARALVGA